MTLKGADAEKRTLVEDWTHFKGSLTSIGPMVVKGKIEGDLHAPSLRISDSGAVHGKVKVGEIVSEGELTGEFDAELVQLSGIVLDKTVVRAKSLQVKLNAPTGRMEVIFGECLLDVGELPDKQAAVRASLSEGRSSLPPEEKK